MIHIATAIVEDTGSRICTCMIPEATLWIYNNLGEES